MLVYKVKQQVILQVQTKYCLRFSTFLTTFVPLFKETTIAINLWTRQFIGGFSSIRKTWIRQSEYAIPLLCALQEDTNFVSAKSIGKTKT
jgi:hypothetical protein